MTIYTFKIEGQDLEQIGTTDRDSSFRPQVGDEIKIASRPETIWKVTRSIPTDNPAAGPVTYIVEDLREINIIRGGGPGLFDQEFVRNSKFGNNMFIK